MEPNETNPSPNPEQDQNTISDYYEGYQKLELQSAESRVRKARNAIFAIAALVLLGNLLIMETTDTFTTAGLLITLAIVGVFTGLAFLTKKQPLTAILLALALFLGLWVLDIVLVGIEQAFKGILVRGIILYFLITGIKHAREAERIRKNLGVS